MKLFREKPLEIAAVQVGYGAVPDGLEPHIIAGKVRVTDRKEVQLPGLMGHWSTVEPGSWLVFRGDGTVTQESGAFFRRRYEAVDADKPIS